MNLNSNLIFSKSMNLNLKIKKNEWIQPWVLVMFLAYKCYLFFFIIIVFHVEGVKL